MGPAFRAAAKSAAVCPHHYCNGVVDHRHHYPRNGLGPGTVAPRWLNRLIIQRFCPRLVWGARTRNVLSLQVLCDSLIYYLLLSLLLMAWKHSEFLHSPRLQPSHRVFPKCFSLQFTFKAHLSSGSLKRTLLRLNRL